MSQEKTSFDPYKVLDLEKGASQEDIKSAYLQAKSSYSSNNPALYSLVDEDSIYETIQSIEQAYQQLTSTPVDQAPDIKSNEPPAEIIDSSLTYQTKITCQNAKKISSEDLFNQLMEEENLDLGDGMLYRKFREKLEVAPQEITAQTKIPTEHIFAIEANKKQRLPYIVYIRGFLRSYFKYLGITNSQKIIEAYCQRIRDENR